MRPDRGAKDGFRDGNHVHACRAIEQSPRASGITRQLGEVPGANGSHGQSAPRLHETLFVWPFMVFMLAKLMRLVLMLLTDVAAVGALDSGVAAAG